MFSALPRHIFGTSAAHKALLRLVLVPQCDTRRCRNSKLLDDAVREGWFPPRQPLSAKLSTSGFTMAPAGSLLGHRIDKTDVHVSL